MDAQTSIPYPDISRLPDDQAQAVSRLVRLVNELRRRRPDLDRVAVSTETALDRHAAHLLAQHIERLGLPFELMLSPWDGRQFMEGKGHDGLPVTPAAPSPPVTPEAVAARARELRASLGK